MEIKICSRCGKEKPFDQFSDERNGRENKNRWCKDCHKDYRLKSKYGISLEEYNIQINKQGHGCVICKKQTNLRVDVSLSGELRGLLCPTCHTVVKLLQKDPGCFDSCFKYLVKFLKKNERLKSKKETRGRPPKLYTALGETHTLKEWVKIIKEELSGKGISENTIRMRIKRGRSIEEAILFYKNSSSAREKNLPDCPNPDSNRDDINAGRF